MTLLLSLETQGQARISGQAPERSAPARRVPANAGHGDVRKKIVPIVRPPAGPSATEWEGGAFLTLAQWLEAPQAGGGVLLQPADDARLLDGKLSDVGLVAVDFPRIGDGRGYTHAYFLRERLGYRGPLRALGAITADQIHALARVGFDSFALRDDQAEEAARGALRTFSVSYQEALKDRDAAILSARTALLEQTLTEIASRWGRPALASSLSAEDMVITDAIARLKLPIDVFTLDTGRLHAETVSLIAETEQRYGLRVEALHPEAEAVELYVRAFGRDGFYDGVEERKMCCRIRKVEPLNRALAGRGAWITGQRREQALTRGELPESQHDDERQMEKFNPLADWSWSDVLAYAHHFNTPMNALYARGYVSIGCEPCTKAIRLGEDPRAGRWWWENQESRECGLHINTTTR